MLTFNVLFKILKYIKKKNIIYLKSQIFLFFLEALLIFTLIKFLKKTRNICDFNYVFVLL